MTSLAGASEIGPDQTQARLGPIKLSPGIEPVHALIFLLAHGILACLADAIGMVQPYVLAEVMHIPAAQQGEITGNLIAAQQVALIIFLVLFGPLADRFGRRIFLIISSIGMILVYALYPFASAIIALVMLRFLFGASRAAHVAAYGAMRVDLPDIHSLGRFNIAMSLSGLAITALFVSYLAVRLPAWLTEGGMSASEAGRYSLWLIAGLAVVALIASFALKNDRPVHSKKASLADTAKEVVRNLREVAAHARANRRFGLLMLLSPIVRSDSLVMGSFLSLWIMNGSHDQGLDSGQALRTLSTIAIIVGLTDIVSNIIAGLLADRFDRAKMAVTCVALTAVAFSTPMWVHSVTGLTIFAVVIFIQLLEGSTSVVAAAALAEETPAHLRGSTAAVFSWIGQISLTVVALVGGWLFSHVGYTAPFLLVSALAVTWLVVAFAMFGRRLFARS